MPHRKLYRQQPTRISADILRADKSDMRGAMNPLTGIWGTCVTAPSYLASAPNGAGDVGSRATVHCSLLSVHWSFTFSAKEKDAETGLSYFGSRYYSSDLSIWLSVDPQSDKYASLSPYVYCADNPVKLVDPDGEEIDDNLDKWKYNKTTGQLSWYSNTGGKCHQIVVETENTSAGEKVSRTVEFDGAIGRMFDFSVFNPKLDDIINGIIEMGNGAKTFVAGLSFGFASEGFGSALSAALCFYGAHELGDGLITALNAFVGKESDPYGQQDIVKDILNTTVNTGAGLIKDKATTGKQIFKHTTKSYAKSFIWGALQYYFVSHPTCLGDPKGSTIKK